MKNYFLLLLLFFAWCKGMENREELPSIREQFPDLFQNREEYPHNLGLSFNFPPYSTDQNPMPEYVENSVSAIQNSNITLEESGNPYKFQCIFPNCAIFSLWKKSIDTHIRSHTEKRPYVCSTLNCNAAFKRKNDLTQHKISHNPVKKVTCSFRGCTKTFTRQSDLNNHLLKFHHISLQIECNECDASFDRIHYEKHCKELHPELIYQCYLCGKRFYSVKGKRTHFSQNHKSA